MGQESSCAREAPRQTSTTADGRPVWGTKELKIRNMCLGKGSADHLEQVLSSPDDDVSAGDCCLPNAKAAKNDESRKPLNIQELRFENGKTCLHLSAQSGNMDMCRFLVEVKGIDMNIQSDQLLTPMHLACLHDQMDVVLYFISILAKLDIPDVTGKLALDYCQSEEMQAVVSRNIRRGLDDKNEISPEFDYGHFKWSKTADDNFTSQNPLRAHQKASTMASSDMPDSSENRGGSGARAGAPMTPSETESKDECEMDFFSSPMDHGTGTKTSRKLSDVAIKLAPGDDELQLQVNDAKAPLPVPSGFPAAPLPATAAETRPSSGEKSKQSGTYMANIVPKTAAAGSPSPSSKTTSSFYHMFRKDGILTKLADGRQSGRAVTAGNRKHRDV